MLPSILPSTKSDSDPEISPLMNRPLPIVACDSGVVPTCCGRGASTEGDGDAGRGGSGVGFGLTDPVWLGFHIALKVNPFLSHRTGGIGQGNGQGWTQKNISADRTAHFLFNLLDAAQVPLPVHRKITSRLF
jgi:hypothetical protein